jgi:hypothetical protein|tara:strand:+ start:608 stop:838 length:231 start_codon:yes stop_codon:yes gene_type:complete
MGVPQEGETYLDALEGRDLMYHLLELYEKNEIEGDSFTQFLVDNLGDDTFDKSSDDVVVEYIKECLGERIKEYDDT